MILARRQAEYCLEGRNVGLGHHEHAQAQMGFVRKVANRVIFMDRGSIVEDCPKEGFFGNGRVPRPRPAVPLEDPPALSAGSADPGKYETCPADRRQRRALGTKVPAAHTCAPPAAQRSGV